MRPFANRRGRHRCRCCRPATYITAAKIFRTCVRVRLSLFLRHIFCILCLLILLARKINKREKGKKVSYFITSVVCEISPYFMITRNRNSFSCFLQRFSCSELALTTCNSGLVEMSTCIKIKDTKRWMRPVNVCLCVFVQALPAQKLIYHPLTADYRQTNITVHCIHSRRTMEMNPWRDAFHFRMIIIFHIVFLFLIFQFYLLALGWHE